MPKFNDITSKRFTRLVALSIVSRGNSEGVKWLCKCDCGKLMETYSKRLTNGSCKSCGCLKHDLVIEHNTTHGMSKTRLYHTWQNMNRRVFDTKDKSFNHYGGRGITICTKWLSFEGFYEDMEQGYTNDLTIDRINNDGNYEKSNCRWVTQQEQVNNYSQNDIHTFNGVTNNLTRLCELNNKNVGLVKCRLQHGYDIDTAMMAPISIGGRKLIKIEHL